MREVTREEIKKIQLDELDYIVNICNENNIDYWPWTIWSAYS